MRQIKADSRNVENQPFAYPSMRLVIISGIYKHHDFPV